MYALVRPGPYACAEWEEGGYPAWLNADPSMIQREMGPSVPYAKAYLKKVYGIIAKHQVNQGGNVFLVQIENEHRPEWGTEATDPYLKYLDDQARANGIEVPMFNSGLHHGNEPAGEAPFSVGTSPWYSTEFWTQYFNHYGEMNPAALAEKTRGAWKLRPSAEPATTSTWRMGDQTLVTRAILLRLHTISPRPLARPAS